MSRLDWKRSPSNRGRFAMESQRVSTLLDKLLRLRLREVNWFLTDSTSNSDGIESPRKSRWDKSKAKSSVSSDVCSTHCWPLWATLRFPIHRSGNPYRDLLVKTKRCVPSVYRYTISIYNKYIELRSLLFSFSAFLLRFFVSLSSLKFHKAAAASIAGLPVADGTVFPRHRANAAPSRCLQSTLLVFL